MIKTRFAPSPTGFFHLGSAKACLFAYLFAMQNYGQFLLRIDDTDTERSKEEYIDHIKQSLKWLGISYDYTFQQSNRTAQYDKAFAYLQTIGAIYECWETQEEILEIQQAKKLQRKAPLFCKSDRYKTEGKSYWRFELNEETFEFYDLIFGLVVSQKNWSDPIIKKPDGTYTYMFTSVVDDILENITHIIRGSEHLYNTFIQINIAKMLLGKKWDVQFAHFPLLLDGNHHKLSKRDVETLTLTKLQESYDVWTLWSFLTQVGSSKKPIFARNANTYIKNFDIGSYSNKPQVFSLNQLDQIQRKIFHHIEPSEVPEIEANLVVLFRTCVNNISQLKHKVQLLTNFIVPEDHFLHKIYSLEQLKNYANNANKKFPELCREIYRMVFQVDYSIPMENLLPLLKRANNPIKIN